MSESVDDLPAFPVRRESPFAPPLVYAQWRETEPVKQVRLANGKPAWVLTRHEDVRHLLGELDRTHLTNNRLDPQFPKLRSGVIGLSQNSNLLFMDEPEHGRIRRMLAPSFTAKKVASMRPGIQATVDGVIAKMLHDGSPADLHQAFSLPIPSLVICQLLGVPYEDHHVFETLTGSLLSRATTPEQYKSALDGLSTYMWETVRRKDEDPSAEDLIGRLIIEHVRAGDLTHEQVVGLAMLMLVAGHETTANTISMGVLNLLCEPETRSALERDPTLIPGSIDEMVRAHSINDLVTLRLATADFEIGGCPIKAGEGVIGLNAAANHDSGAFADPDGFDPTRDTRGHVGFGFGIHSCLGQSLARAELEIAFTALLGKVPGLRLELPVEDLDFKHDGFVFGLHSLPVSW